MGYRRDGKRMKRRSKIFVSHMIIDNIGPIDRKG